VCGGREALAPVERGQVVGARWTAGFRFADAPGGVWTVTAELTEQAGSAACQSSKSSNHQETVEGDGSSQGLHTIFVSARQARQPPVRAGLPTVRTTPAGTILISPAPSSMQMIGTALLACRRGGTERRVPHEGKRMPGFVSAPLGLTSRQASADFAPRATMFNVSTKRPVVALLQSVHPRKWRPRSTSAAAPKARQRGGRPAAAVTPLSTSYTIATTSPLTRLCSAKARGAPGTSRQRRRRLPAC